LEALKLGDRHVGPEHELLAILSAPVDDDPARVALEAHGVTHQRLTNLLAPTTRLGRPGNHAVTTNPGWHEASGWCRGFAVARSADSTSADMLLAVIYTDRRVVGALERLGVRSGDLVATLAELGVPIPARPAGAGKHCGSASRCRTAS
jgi:hypothetical protein